MNNEEYKRLVSEKTPKSPILKDCIMAFLFGGGICTIGQILKDIYISAGISEKNASLGVSVTLIFVAAILTGFGVFDKIGKIAGAGTAVPITGFANAVVSPALEFHAEGFILGTAAKMFQLAGPVIVFGVVSSIIYGVIYWIYLMF